ncbi:hypothetical protein D2Q93_11810 [Alicyclobacillaceae bacterium I2511]|nr:hypothetical protein D2Q93_11810 [Alicyclobacillaceae bacterium I2511]
MLVNDYYAELMLAQRELRLKKVNQDVWQYQLLAQPNRQMNSSTHAHTFVTWLRVHHAFH